MKRRVIPRIRGKLYPYVAGGIAGNTRWKLFRKLMLRNKQAELRVLEPNLAKFQRKKRYLYRDLVESIIVKETNK